MGDGGDPSTPPGSGPTSTVGPKSPREASFYFTRRTGCSLFRPHWVSPTRVGPFPPQGSLPPPISRHRRGLPRWPSVALRRPGSPSETRRTALVVSNFLGWVPETRGRPLSNLQGTWGPPWSGARPKIRHLCSLRSTVGAALRTPHLDRSDTETRTQCGEHPPGHSASSALSRSCGAPSDPVLSVRGYESDRSVRLTLCSFYF